MKSSTIKELESARSKLAELERQAAEQTRAELSTLHTKYGFADPRAFIRALRRACPGNGPRKARKGRAVITDATRSLVKQRVAAGRTGAQIADELAISVPTVQNIKKALGLVRARK